MRDVFPAGKGLEKAPIQFKSFFHHALVPQVHPEVDGGRKSQRVFRIGTDFFEHLRGGSVTKREESLDSGDAGPWLYIYWKKDKSQYQVFEFETWGDLKEFEAYCESFIK